MNFVGKSQTTRVASTFAMVGVVAAIAYIIYKTNALAKKTVALEDSVTATGDKLQNLEQNTNETMDTILYIANAPPPKGTNS